MSSDDNSTIESAVYKERIDSLFRIEHSDGSDTVKPEEPTMEHLKLHFQKVMSENRVTPNRPPKNMSTTYIQVNDNTSQSPNAIKVNSPESTQQAEHPITRSKSFLEARTAVQAQIERMFNDASKVVGHEDSTFNSNKAIIEVRSQAPPRQDQAAPIRKIPQFNQNVPLPPIPVESSQVEAQITTPVKSAAVEPKPMADSTAANVNKYKVDYLGSLALPGRATNLDSLQLPLKDLYAKYRHSLANKLNVYRGTMDISVSGLRIQYYTDWRTTIPVEILNPFPTIAVWAAVKFVHRSEVTARGVTEKKFAFLPLICDPENQDKQNLFHALNANNAELLTSAPSHPPMFTCVMRKMGAPKILECHAFVCDNPEDAIVIAANLYQALLRNMKNDKAQAANEPPAPSTVTSEPKQPVADNKAPEPQYSPASSVSNWSDSSVASGVPVRPPRRKKKVQSQGGGGGIDRAHSIRRTNSKGRGSQMQADLRRSIRRNNSKGRATQARPDLRRSMRTSSQRARIRRSISEKQLNVNANGEPQLDNPSSKSQVLPRSKSFLSVAENYSVGELIEQLKVSNQVPLVIGKLCI